MTLDLGSPFKVSAKPYIIAAVDQTLPGDSKYSIVILIMVALMLGIAALIRRGKRDV